MIEAGGIVVQSVPVGRDGPVGPLNPVGPVKNPPVGLVGPDDAVDIIWGLMLYSFSLLQLNLDRLKGAAKKEAHWVVEKTSNLN